MLRGLPLKMRPVPPIRQTETCASCHGFVTRIDYAFTGVWEV